MNYGVSGEGAARIAAIYVEIADDLRLQLFHLTEVMREVKAEARTNAQIVTKSLDAFRVSMDLSSDRMLKLTRWIMVAAIVSGLGVVAQAIVAFVK